MQFNRSSGGVQVSIQRKKTVERSFDGLRKKIMKKKVYENKKKS